MPFKLGNLSGEKIYLGSTEVTKVYLGTEVVYSSGPDIVDKNWSWVFTQDGFLPNRFRAQSTEFLGINNASFVVNPSLTPHIKNNAPFSFGTWYSRILRFAPGSASPTFPEIRIEDIYDNGIISGESDIVNIGGSYDRVWFEIIYDPKWLKTS